MKHYVIILDWAANDECGVEILGVGDTYDEAKEIFNQHLAEEKQFAENNGYDIETDTENEFDAGVMGSWNTDHTTLYIKEVN